MSLDTREEATPVASDPILLLPEHPKRMGPVTRLLVLRTAAGVAVVQLVGLFLVLGVGGPRATAAGLSAAFPGGGLLYARAPIPFALTLGLVVLSIVLWWGMSMIWGLPLVWLLSGLLATALAGPHAWGWSIPVPYVLALASLAGLVWSFEKRFRTKRDRIPALNAFLETAAPPEPAMTWRAPDATDTELQRWCYELALQPLDRFDGFEWGEQLHGGTCVRYQLNYLGWALAQYAANNLPNAPTEIELVLRNLVLKQTDLRVWGYWKSLNTIGNLNTNPDPLVKDNIMFSGFTGDQLNMYEAATGSDFFDQPGSLTFVWKDGTTYAYDHHSWMAEVRRNFDAGRTAFFPCEPGWAFAACNTIGAQALLGYETLHGGTLWSDLEPRWRQTLDEEYALPDGNYANIRCTRTGLSWDTGETPGGEYLVTGTNSFADVAPDLARRGRAIATKGLPEKLGGLRMLLADGELALELPEELERNRARKTALGAWTKLVGGARMVGDGELAEAAIRASDRQCATGERWPERPVAAGVQTMATHLIVRWGSPITTAVLNVRGYVAPTGPLLGPVAWPQAMATVARSTDGVSLDLSIVPVEGSATDVVELTFSQLVPGARYRVGDQGIVADANGEGSVAVVLEQAAALRLEPVAGPNAGAAA